MNLIHPTAIIHPAASLGDDNVIGPYCVIGQGVSIGDHNLIEGYSSIGQAAEHKDFFLNPGGVVIGSHNIVREFTTINAGTKWVTKMGNNCLMLRGSHLSHDSILEDNVTLSCNALVGGESYIMRWANLGLGAIIHQRTLVGTCVMLGMGAVVPKGLPLVSGNVFVGNPARRLKANLIGLLRAGIEDKTLEAEIDRFFFMKESGWNL